QLRQPRGANRGTDRIRGIVSGSGSRIVFSIHRDDRFGGRSGRVGPLLAGPPRGGDRGAVARDSGRDFSTPGAAVLVSCPSVPGGAVLPADPSGSEQFDTASVSFSAFGSFCWKCPRPRDMKGGVVRRPRVALTSPGGRQGFRSRCAGRPPPW